MALINIWTTAIIFKGNNKVTLYLFIIYKYIPENKIKLEERRDSWQ